MEDSDKEVKRGSLQKEPVGVRKQDFKHTTANRKHARLKDTHCAKKVFLS